MTFCAIRMALDEVGVLRNPEGIAQGLPPVVSRKLYEIVAVVAMQFRGYIFKVDEPQARGYNLSGKGFCVEDMDLSDRVHLQLCNLSIGHITLYMTIVCTWVSRRTSH